MIRSMLAGALLAATLVAPAGTDPWPRYPCGSGTLDAGGATVAAASNYPTAVSVAVPAVADCGVKAPGPEVAVAVFTPAGPQGLIYATMRYPYASPTSPTAFQVDGILTPGTYGLCLMPDYDTRLSCVAVKVSSISPPGATVTPLPPDDALVARPVVLDSGLGTQPSCPVCWTAAN